MKRYKQLINNKAFVDAKSMYIQKLPDSKQIIEWVVHVEVEYFAFANHGQGYYVKSIMHMY